MLVPVQNRETHLFDFFPVADLSTLKTDVQRGM